MATIDWETFTETCRNKRRISGNMALSVRETKDILQDVDWTGPEMDSLATLTRRFIPAVQAEIDLLDLAREHSWFALARRAIVFGLTTPQRDVDTAIDVALWVTRPEHIHRLCTLDGAIALVQKYEHRDGRMVGLSGYKALGKSLHLAYPVIADPRPDALTVTALESMHGVGKKVARMITAVLNPHVRVYTVDLWHARQLLAAAGRNYAVKPYVSTPAYEMIEGAFLAYVDRVFPGVPAWTAQWSMYDAAYGEHRSHARLWADLIGY